MPAARRSQCGQVNRNPRILARVAGNVMVETCEVCRERPASVRDYTLRSGRWIDAAVCDDCARRRRQAILPYFGAALSAATLFAGAAFAIERLGRREGEGPSANPAGEQLGRFLRGAGPSDAWPIFARSDRRSTGRRARPGDRPRTRGRARRFDLGAAQQEQPGAHRRTGRRQDGHRRRSRAADRRAATCPPRCATSACWRFRSARSSPAPNIAVNSRDASSASSTRSSARPATSSCSSTSCTRSSAPAPPKARSTCRR